MRERLAWWFFAPARWLDRQLDRPLSAVEEFERRRDLFGVPQAGTSVRTSTLDDVEPLTREDNRE